MDEIAVIAGIADIARDRKNQRPFAAEAHEATGRRMTEELKEG
jgi:hypothetical protein